MSLMVAGHRGAALARLWGWGDCQRLGISCPYAAVAAWEGFGFASHVARAEVRKLGALEESLKLCWFLVSQGGLPTYCCRVLVTKTSISIPNRSAVSPPAQ